MLETLRLIAEELSGALNPHQALTRIVQIIKEHLAVDVCSMYLADAMGESYVLTATSGLDPGLIGRLRLSRNDGLIGLVAAQAKTLAVQDAYRHPRFRDFPHLGEKRYRAFMGVPILRRRRVLGVLSVRNVTERRFGRQEENWLIAVAAELAGALGDSAPPDAESPSKPPPALTNLMLRGIAAAPGMTVGEVVLPSPEADLETVQDRLTQDALAEEARFRAAVAQVQAELRTQGSQLAVALPASDIHVLFSAYTLLLGDHRFVEDVVRRIRDGNWAPGALRGAIDEYSRVFDVAEDAYLRVRAEDIRGLGRRILLRLQAPPLKARKFPARCILAGEEIGIPRIAEVPVKQLAGILCNRGSSFSHAAILARILGIPAVVGLGDLPLEQLAGRTAVVDGGQGCVFVEPSPALLQELQQVLQHGEEQVAALQALRDWPATTPDGFSVALQANAGFASDVARALAWGAEGIGLYRTEYSFVMSDGFPSEDEQYEMYREVLAGLAPKPVTMRTLDIGGDKGLPYFPVLEANPFLGWRGIRLTLDTPGILLNQFRAMLRANAGCDNLKILLPMVSTVRQIDEAALLLERACADLRGAGQPITRPPLGAMIEVPAAIYQMRALACRVDFFSIGTNDLTQYLLAVDRGNARVAKLYDNLHPAVIAALQATVRTAHRYARPISVCGEMAGDPAAVILLLGMAVDGLTMAAGHLPNAKLVIQRFTQPHARELLAKARRLEDASQVRDLLHDALAKAGLGDVLETNRALHPAMTDAGPNSGQ